MVVNDEITKEIKGQADIMAINIYRLNECEVGIDEEIDVEAMALKIAEEIKTRFRFYKVALPDNKKAQVFMLEAAIANINAISILAPEDMLPTEMIQTQVMIQKVLEEEGFAKKDDNDIEEFGDEGLIKNFDSLAVSNDDTVMEIVLEEEKTVTIVDIAADAAINSEEEK